MRKTTISVDNQNLFENQNKIIEVGIVSRLINGKHSHEYQIFDLKKPISNIGLIGVNSNEVFAIQFKFNCDGDYAFAAYLDGINVSQSIGIHSLNEINEDQRNKYKMHRGIFIIRDAKKHKKAYLNRFNQINGENRLFTFTTDVNSGINEILINDVSISNKIEIYFWREIVEEFDEMIGNHILFMPALTKVGAGEATHEEYKKGTHLSNPEFLGKVIFIHVNANAISHLGKTLLSVNEIEDPMNNVPKT